MKLEVKNDKFSIYTFYFFAYSILGWCMETVYSILTLGYFIKRGFLFGPLCPIYGCGALILLFFLDNYKRNSATLFIYSALVFSVFEYFVGFLLEATLRLKCWDYTDDFFNLNGRITIFFSIGWGIISVLFISKIHPFISKKTNILIKKISSYNKNLILYGLITIFLVDNVFSIIKYIKLF